MAMLFRLLRATVLDSAQVVQYVTNAGSLILNLLAIPKSMHKKNIYIYISKYPCSCQNTNLLGIKDLCQAQCFLYLHARHHHSLNCRKLQ